MMRSRGSGYWGEIGEHWSSEAVDVLWRRHSDNVNSRLLREWLPETYTGIILKTDLFDEVHGEGLIPMLLAPGRCVVGMDIADSAFKRTVSSSPGWIGVKADVRRLPFDNQTFDAVVSTSTIDHFNTIAELALCLGEFRRVLKPRGQLILTVDNLANPLIFIRNHLPFKALNRLGLVPYYIGATCGPRRLRKLVSSEALAVQEVTAIEHCPRVAAVALSRLIDRYATPEIKTLFLEALMMFEYLRIIPTRFLSGYYVALRAVRIDPEDDT